MIPRKASTAQVPPRKLRASVRPRIVPNTRAQWIEVEENATWNNCLVTMPCYVSQRLKLNRCSFSFSSRIAWTWYFPHCFRIPKFYLVDVNGAKSSVELEANRVRLGAAWLPFHGPCAGVRRGVQTSMWIDFDMKKTRDLRVNLAMLT